MNSDYSSEYADFITEVYNRELNNTIDVTPVNTDNVSKADEDISIVTVSFEDDYAPKNEIDKQYLKLVAAADKSYKNKEFDAALASYKEALAINPSDEQTLLKVGNVYRAQDDFKTASSYYKKAILTNINYTDAWFNLGLAYAEDKNNEEAIKAFKKVTEIDPNYAYAYYALGIAYEAEGKIQDAVKNYEAFLQYSNDEKTKEFVRGKLKKLK